jgi:hypothetical protein
MAVISNLSDTTGLVGSASMPDGSALNYDMLPNNRFRVIIPSQPYLEMFLQGFTLPEIKVNTVQLNSRYCDIQEIGEKMVYSPYTLTFKIDSQMSNWKHIMMWMKSMTVSGSNVGHTENIVLMISNTEALRLMGSWPMTLGGLEFKTTENGANYMTCSVLMNCDYIDLLLPAAGPDAVY